MADAITLYISAAADLYSEREILGRIAAEIPIDIGWRIMMSPKGNEPVDYGMLAQADIHLLIMGGDIRAPVGLEWLAAKGAGKSPVPFLKQNTARTSAGLSFVRFISEQSAWRPFKEAADLRLQCLRLLGEHLNQAAGLYALSQAEVEILQNWRAQLVENLDEYRDPAYSGTGESGLILSRERFIPGEGTLLQTDEQSDIPPEDYE